MHHHSDRRPLPREKTSRRRDYSASPRSPRARSDSRSRPKAAKALPPPRDVPEHRTRSPVPHRDPRHVDSRKNRHDAYKSEYEYYSSSEEREKPKPPTEWFEANSPNGTPFQYDRHGNTRLPPKSSSLPDWIPCQFGERTFWKHRSSHEITWSNPVIPRTTRPKACPMAPPSTHSAPRSTPSRPIEKDDERANLLSQLHALEAKTTLIKNKLQGSCTPPPPPLSMPTVGSRTDDVVSSTPTLKLSMRVIAGEEDIKNAQENFKSLLVKSKFPINQTPIAKVCLPELGNPTLQC